MVLIFMGFLLLLHGRCPCARLEKSTKKQNNSVPRQHDETPEPERRPLRQDDARRADPTRNCNPDRKRRARTGRPLALLAAPRPPAPRPTGHAPASLGEPRRLPAHCSIPPVRHTPPPPPTPRWHKRNHP